MNDQELGRLVDAEGDRRSGKNPQQGHFPSMAMFVDHEPWMAHVTRKEKAPAERDRGLELVAGGGLEPPTPAL